MRRTIIGATLTLALLPLNLLLGHPVADSSPVSHGAGSSSAASLRPPAVPPAKICGSRSLRGPSTRPKGAVAVSPKQNLGTVVLRHRGRTTFWLKRGTYRLGPGIYDQVQPKNGDVFIGAPGAVLDGQRRNKYAFTGQASGVRISYLTIQNFGTSIRDNPGEGVVNHDSGHRWTMTHLTVRSNAGAGVFLGSGDVVADDCLIRNGEYGFSAYSATGVSNVRLVHNEIAYNNTANWEKLWPGCGCTGGGKFWAVRNAVVTGNWVHNNDGAGLWADTNDTGFLFKRNFIEHNRAEGLIYEASYNARIVANTFVRNAIGDGPTVGFPDPALYIAESGSDLRAGSRYGDRFRIVDNWFVNNFSAIALWENANRFVGSPDNGSTGATTLVNPHATVAACTANIAQAPYFDDCRWKTKNVLVAGNTFVFEPSKMPPSCKVSVGCGYVGVFSEYGSLAPYQGDVVPDHITYRQHNLFRDNTYIGPWHFMAHELGTEVSWKQWRSAKYRQDAGSTRTLRR